MGDARGAEESARPAWYPALVDFVAGTVGGAAGIVAGQPLDTVKVRQQVHATQRGQYASPWRAVRTIVRGEGMRGLYKGMSSPLYGVAAINAVVFWGYGTCARALGQRDATAEQEATELPLSRVYLAGAGAGFANVFVATPVELVKVQLQLQEGRGREAVTFRGVSDCLRHLTATRGVVPGWFQGFWATMWRDFPSYGVYFFAYEALRRQMTPAGGEASHMATLLAGGFAGCAAWTTCYPVDVVKSKVQAQHAWKRAAPLRTTRECARDAWRRGGVRAFTSGFSATQGRAFVVNAATFFTYELVCSALKSAQ